MTKLYGGIDLHANNSVIVLVDDQEQVVYEKRIPNDLPKILSQLRPFQTSVHGLFQESYVIVIIVRNIFPPIST